MAGQKLVPKLPAVKGSAPIEQIGHTSGTRFGQDAHATTRGGNRKGHVQETLK